MIALTVAGPNDIRHDGSTGLQNDAGEPNLPAAVYRGRTNIRAKAILLALAVLLGAPQGFAQNKAAAEALFDEGRELLAQGHYLQAAQKLEESQRLDAGIGTLLYLASAYEKAGKLASAWANYREAAAAAAEKGETRRVEIATTRAERLEPLLSRLIIELGPNRELDGVTVRRGDWPMDPSLSGVALPVDAGPYRVSVSAPGRQTWVAQIQVEPAGQTTTIEVPLLEIAPSAPSAQAEPSGAAVGSEQPAPAGSAGQGQRIGALVLGLGGVAGLGIGFGFMGSALSSDAEADEHCVAERCRDLEGAELAGDAGRAANVATAGFVVGAAALGGAVVLWLTAPSSLDAQAPSTGAVGLGLTVGRGGDSVGWGVGGVW